jgi:hypothetical protein
MHRIATALLPRYCQGSLPSVVMAWMRAQLQTNAALAAMYDGLRAAERASAGHDGMSAGQLDNMWKHLDELLDADVVAADTRKQRWSFGAVGATMGAVAIAAAIVWWPRSVGEGVDGGLGTLTSRAAAMDQAPLGMRVRCLQDNKVTADASAGARQHASTLQCGSLGLLAFSATNLSQEVRYAFVVGVDAENHVVFVPPFTAQTSALAVAAGRVDDVMESLMPMSAAGDGLTLFVLMSDAPFDGGDIAQRLRSAQRAGLSLKSLDRLPVDVPVQARIILETAR